MQNVKEINSTEFVQEVLNSNTPVVVDFYAPWCGPCKMLAPVLDSLASEYNGTVKFVKLNVDDAPTIAASFNITGVPTIIVFKDGKVADVAVGYQSAGALRAMIDKYAKPKKSAGGASCGCCCGW